MKKENFHLDCFCWCCHYFSPSKKHFQDCHCWSFRFGYSMEVQSIKIEVLCDEYRNKRQVLTHSEQGKVELVDLFEEEVTSLVSRTFQKHNWSFQFWNIPSVMINNKLILGNELDFVNLIKKLKISEVLWKKMKNVAYQIDTNSSETFLEESEKGK